MSVGEILMAAVLCGFLFVGGPFGVLIGSRMTDRWYEAEKLRRARVDHVPELDEKATPFIVDFAAECRIFFREILLKFKLLVQKLFLKSMCEPGAQDGADNCSKNRASNSSKQNVVSHGGQ